MYNIPYGKQSIDENDIAAVTEALKADYLTQGPRIAEFEKAFANYVGAKYAVANANGTAALHLCALALGVNGDTNVIATPITFAASSNCIRYCNGNVHFADIDPDTYLLDANRVEDMLKAKGKGFFSGIVPVDFTGRAADMEDFATLAEKYELWIIEDACHAPGGYFTDKAGKKVFCGSGEYADLAIFSFHPVKHIACGEGGMITTNDKSLYEKLLRLRTHGITKDAAAFVNDIPWASGNAASQVADYPGWYMEMQDLGYNYRLTDFQAALGISQLKKADAGLERRRAIAANYARAFTDKDYILGQSGLIEGHAYHLYVLEVEDRLGLYNYLRTQGIYAQVHYVPTHLMPYYRQLGWKEGDMPHAEKYYSRCLSLPMYPTLTEDEQNHVIKSVANFYNR